MAALASQNIEDFVSRISEELGLDYSDVGAKLIAEGYVKVGQLYGVTLQKLQDLGISETQANTVLTRAATSKRTFPLRPQALVLTFEVPDASVLV